MSRILIVTVTDPFGRVTLPRVRFDSMADAFSYAWDTIAIQGMHDCSVAVFPAVPGRFSGRPIPAVLPAVNGSGRQRVARGQWLALAVAGLAILGYGITRAHACDSGPQFDLVAVFDGELYGLDSGLTRDDCARAVADGVESIVTIDGRTVSAATAILFCESN